MDPIVHRIVARFVVALDLGVPAGIEMGMPSQRAAASTQELTVKFRNTVERVLTYRGKQKRDEVFAVLQHFGWKVEPVTAFLDHGEVTKDFNHGPDAEKFHAAILKAYAVQTLPVKAEPKWQYVLDLAAPVETLYGHTVKYKLWEGVEAWRIASPDGRFVYEMLPSKYDRVKTRNRIDPESLVRWLQKDTDLPDRWKEMAAQKREQYVRSREGTGSCPCCFRNIKLDDGDPLMVLHGYRRPGDGAVIGRCPGVSYPPYELSPKGTIHLRDDIIKPEIQSIKGSIQKVEDDTVDFIIVSPYKGISRGQVDATEWARELAAYDKRLKHKLADREATLKLVEKLINEWKLAPLPEAGQDLPVSRHLVF